MQSLFTADLLAPISSSKDAKIVQLSASPSGELALFSYTSTSSNSSDTQQGSFIRSFGAKNEELYNEPGSIVCCSHDLSQVVRFFNRELYFHAHSSIGAYVCIKTCTLSMCIPKFASLVKLTTGQSVLIVLGALVRRLSSEEVSKYFSECSHQDPLKIAASYTFLYVLHSETGAQVNSFLIPIKRKNSIVDVSYDTAGLLHIYYRNSQDALLKLIVKPLEFYNLHFTKDSVLLLDSRGEYVRPLSPSITQRTLRLEAIHASRISAPEPLFGRLSCSSITLHILCDYVNAKHICHIYEEDPESGEVHTLFKEIVSNSAMYISSAHDKLYYINPYTQIFHIVNFDQLIKHVLQIKESLCRFTWTSDNTRFFKEFCGSSSSPITLINKEDFESYSKAVESLRPNDDSSLQQNAGESELQMHAVTTNQSGNSNEHDLPELPASTQDFSILSNSVISEFAQGHSDSSELDAPMASNGVGAHMSSSSFDELSARVLVLEETLRMQSADHRKLIKELEEFYDTVGSIADKQAKLSRKLDDFIKGKPKDISTSPVEVAKMPHTDACAISQDQSETLGRNLKVLTVTLYQIAVSITSLAVKLAKRVGSRLSARKSSQ